MEGLCIAYDARPRKPPLCREVAFATPFASLTPLALCGRPTRPLLFFEPRSLMKSPYVIHNGYYGAGAPPSSSPLFRALFDKDVFLDGRGGGGGVFPRP
jgi:hypothetical protein